MSIIPLSRPKLPIADVQSELLALGITEFEKQAVLLGKRGYYGNTFAPAGNNRGVYDDAMFFLSPNAFAAFNCNCDPSTVLQGRRALAQLIPGIYKFQLGLHKGRYQALRAYPEGVKLPCLRAGKPSECQYINIHKGGVRNTWSEGCQTIPETQWKSFITLVEGEIKRYGQKTITYVLTEN